MSLNDQRCSYTSVMPTDPLICCDAEIQGGTPCFTGTRVPIRSFFDVIKRGRTADYFLSQFPAVTRQQVDGVLDRASQALGAAQQRMKLGVHPVAD